MDAALITKAASYAGEAHKRQKRKATGLPYVNHVLRVGHAAAEANLSSQAIAAAYLHDVIEDTWVTQEDLSKEFPGHVVELVLLLTKQWPKSLPKEKKIKANAAYFEAICKNKEATAIKLLDRADNLIDMIRTLHRARRWAQRYLKKSQHEMNELRLNSDNPFAKQRFEFAIEALTEALTQEASVIMMNPLAFPKLQQRSQLVGLLKQKSFD